MDDFQTAEKAANAFQHEGFFANVVTGIQQAFERGDPWLFFILLAALFAIIFVLERFFRLYFHYSINGKEFMREIERYVYDGDTDGAIRVCNAKPNASLPQVIKAGLQRASRSEEQIQNALDAASLEQIPKLERRLSYIGLIANLATLLGLLGTIAGLIRSFGAIGAELADPSQRQAMLSAGIAEAMNATALGLLTAIFAMIMHNILANKANRITEEIDEYSVKLLDYLSTHHYKHSTESK